MPCVVRLGMVFRKSFQFWMSGREFLGMKSLAVLDGAVDVTSKQGPRDCAIPHQIGQRPTFATETKLEVEFDESFVKTLSIHVNTSTLNMSIHHT